MPTAFLDADVVAFQATTGAQVPLGDDETAFSLKKAQRSADDQIDTWKVLSRCTDVVLVLSPADGSNFRKTILPSYKSGRSDKPHGYWEVVTYLEKNYRVIRIPHLEGDDVCGIYATSDRFPKAVVVSPDKDMKTLPVRFLRTGKMKRPKLISKREADRYWMYQTLIGDPTDGYKGCPKIGPVKAEAILSQGTSLPQWWDLVVETYETKGLSAKDALVQARCARILRREDFWKEENAIRLWHPNPHQTDLYPLR